MAKYYGYRCYTKNHETLGWLYTFDCDREYAWTNKDLDWCKRWKTHKGAQKHFEHCQNVWEAKSQGGYLKIEVMPEEDENSSSNLAVEEQEKLHQKAAFWLFNPTDELAAWLEEERGIDDAGNLESKAALVNRKLEKLRKLEEQGF